ncbi:Uncharacterised protein [Mycobacteroides abscessus subsp. abscessus]|nr:Uncharacterised protein [Mycobacteroides abscessus subsp. abscessus]
MDAAAHRFVRAARTAARRDHVGLHLQHLIALGRNRFRRCADQAEAHQVVGVGVVAVGVAAARAFGDHRQTLGDHLRADVEGAAGAHIDHRLCAVRSQEAQDARLVGRQLVDDPGVGRMGVLDIGDIGRPP